MTTKAKAVALARRHSNSCPHCGGEVPASSASELFDVLETTKCAGCGREVTLRPADDIAAVAGEYLRIVDTHDHTLEMLQLVDRHDLHLIIWWRAPWKGRDVIFMINVNDDFYMASADCEEILPEDVPALRRAISDCEDSWAAALLYVARRRGMRPLAAAYPDDCPEAWPLLDAAGPEREDDPTWPHRGHKAWRTHQNAARDERGLDPVP